MATKTVKPQERTQADELQTEHLSERNKCVQTAFNHIVENVTSLLKPFFSQRYRTYILVEHSASGKETNLIMEFLCSFFTITLTTNKVGYRMIYLTYDSDSISKFGARLYNRVLRQIFKHTEEKIVEDCVRINNPGNVISFYLTRLSHGENDYTTIDIQEQD